MLNKNIPAKKLLIRYVILTFVLSTLIILTITVSNMLKYKQLKNSETNKIASDKFAGNITAELQNAVLFTKLLSLNINISNKDSGIKELTKKLKNILKSENSIEGLWLYQGDPTLLINNKNSFLQDSSENYKTLTLNKTGKIITSSEYFIDEETINRLNTKNFSENTEIMISEPYKFKNGKKNINVIDLTAFIFHNKKITGLLTVHYNTKKLSLLLTKDTQTQQKFILLSPNNNIIASSMNKQNIGKNILNLHGEEFSLYNMLQKSDNNNHGNISKISLTNTENEFELLSSYQKTMSKKFYYLFLQFFIISLIVTTLGIFFIIYLINKSFFSLKKLVHQTEILSKGENSIENTKNIRPEYKKAVENLNAISEYQKEVSSFAEQIIKRNYNIRIKPRSEIDDTTESLNKISAFLKENKLKQTAEEEKTFLQLWMRKGRFEISEAERNSSKDIQELSYNIIRSIVNYIDALMGGIYLYNKEIEEIELISAYAYQKHKHFNANFKPGEGIVGACILEKKKVILNKVPEDYIKIATGLGSGTPSYIAVIPIEFKNEINAAIEVAFMNKPEDYKIEFIEQLSDSIGAWIDASLISMKTGKLLEISKKQTKELAEKEEELNKKVAELQEIQEKTDEINTRFKSILNAVNQSVMTVEYTTDGTIVNCNKIYTDIMGFTADEIKGTNVTELVKDKAESLKQIIEEVKNGKIIKKEVTRYTKNGDMKQLTATYTPYYDKTGEITQILFFAFDITNINI